MEAHEELKEKEVAGEPEVENGGEPPEREPGEGGEAHGGPREADGEGRETRRKPGEEETAEERLLRLRADFENFRRRSAREREHEFQRGRRDAATALLPVYDSLAMGLNNVAEDNPARGGLEAVYRQLLGAFERIGIERIETAGETFHPDVHEAILRLPSDEPEGTVVQEILAGFRDSVGLLRAAQVAVSSGPAEEGSSNDGGKV